MSTRAAHLSGGRGRPGIGATRRQRCGASRRGELPSLSCRGELAIVEHQAGGAGIADLNDGDEVHGLVQLPVPAGVQPVASLGTAGGFAGRCHCRRRISPWLRTGLDHRHIAGSERPMPVVAGGRFLYRVLGTPNGTLRSSLNGRVSSRSRSPRSLRGTGPSAARPPHHQLSSHTRL